MSLCSVLIIHSLVDRYLWFSYILTVMTKTETYIDALCDMIHILGSLCAEWHRIYFWFYENTQTSSQNVCTSLPYHQQFTEFSLSQILVSIYHSYSQFTTHIHNVSHSEWGEMQTSNFPNLHFLMSINVIPCHLYYILENSLFSASGHFNCFLKLMLIFINSCYIIDIKCF